MGAELRRGWRRRGEPDGADARRDAPGDGLARRVAERPARPAGAPRPRAPASRGSGTSARPIRPTPGPMTRSGPVASTGSSGRSADRQRPDDLLRQARRAEPRTHAAPRRRAARPAASPAPAGTWATSPAPISDATSAGVSTTESARQPLSESILACALASARGCRARPPPRRRAAALGACSMRPADLPSFAQHPIPVEPADHQRRDQPEAAQHLERGGQAAHHDGELQREPGLVAGPLRRQHALVQDQPCSPDEGARA